MAHVSSFPPIVGRSPRTLILGTMPGTASLHAQQYYAHPRNAFWGILADLLGFDARLDYAARTRRLVDADIAVWDVLRSCKRPGSLDSKIEAASVVANDFDTFFARHPSIERVCFNGAAAEALYRRHVVHTLAPTTRPRYVRLPSTSPANASVPVTEKVRLWRVAILADATARRSSASPTSNR
jgi:TDG/mug DNA glycosylase family protein